MHFSWSLKQMGSSYPPPAATPAPPRHGPGPWGCSCKKPITPIRGTNGVFNLMKKGLSRSNCWKLKANKYRLEVQRRQPKTGRTAWGSSLPAAGSLQAKLGAFLKGDLPSKTRWARYRMSDETFFSVIQREHNKWFMALFCPYKPWIKALLSKYLS